LLVNLQRMEVIYVMLPKTSSSITSIDQVSWSSGMILA
jgi:hypothetical protein